MLRTLGGPLGFGSALVAIGDDNSSAAIPLAGTFPGGLDFYGASYTTAFVNNNGNVSFGAAMGAYAPLLSSAVSPVVAAWWGDVDTRGAGRPGRNNVQWYTDGSRLVATWHLVGFFNSDDALQNSFQLILTHRSDVSAGDFDVELRYEQCQWTTGDASGGTRGLGGMSASAGISSGNGVDVFELPGSRTMAILDLCATSNVGLRGVWRYRMRDGRPM